MSDTLSRICDTTRAALAERMRAHPLAEIETAAKEASPVRGFVQTLTETVAQGRPGLIAEIKKASPSQGVLRADFDPAAIAQAYTAAGAACLSVLTEPAYFQGSPEDMQAARAACPLPVLRKDFMLDPYQIFESRAMGADCVLLIIAALSPAQAREMESVAFSLGMDVLVEVHDDAEMEVALTKLYSPLIGINNRNLKTLAVDLSTTQRLALMVPTDRKVVCESGIERAEDIVKMRRAGVNRFLVGTSLMRQPDIAAATRTLLTLPPALAS